MRLTVDEIKLIAFIVLGLLVGATVKHYRDIQRANAAPPAQHSPAPPAGAVPPKPNP